MVNGRRSSASTSTRASCPVSPLPAISTMTFQDTFAIFHGNVTTFAFVDGHVESHRWLEASTIQAVKTHTHNWATGDVRKNRDFLWLWNHYQYPTWKPL